MKTSFYNRNLTALIVFLVLFFFNAAVCRSDQKHSYSKDDTPANCVNRKAGIFEDGNNGWEKALSREQKEEIRVQLSQLRQKEAALKNKIEFERIMLRKVVTSENPDEAIIEKHTSRLAELKKEKMKLKYDNMIKIRRILTPEQKTRFDIALLKPACANKRHE